MSLLTETTPHSQTLDSTVMTYRQAILAALEDEMANDVDVVLLGEDVGASGGVFKTSEGLYDRFGPSRVIDTPICENAFLGVALGMAVTGMRPVVEVMFSDFLATGADAMVNEIPKFRFMSGGQMTVPLTVRSIGGGGSRFGTQHSATGESWFIHVKGLHIATCSTPAAAYGILRAAIRSNNPVLIIEHKGLFSSEGAVNRSPSSIAEIGRAELLRPGNDVTVVGTMLMAQRSLRAAATAASTGVEAEVIDLRWTSPMDIEFVLSSVQRTGCLVIVEEQPHPGGWGATLVSELVRRGAPFHHPPIVVSLLDAPIAFSPQLEDAQIPSVERIADAIAEAAKAN